MKNNLICPLMSGENCKVRCEGVACALYISEGELLTTEDLRAPGGCAFYMLVMKNNEGKFQV